MSIFFAYFYFPQQFSHDDESSHLKRFERVYLEDRYIESKLDFSKPINFVVHGWMSGVLDANLHAKGSELDENEGLHHEKHLRKCFN